MLDEGAAPEKNPPPYDEFDDEPSSLQIGSAAANTAGTKDEFDDEFAEIVEPSAVPPPAPSAMGAPPPPSALSAAAFEADRLALLAAAEQAKVKAEAQAQVLEAERVAKLAAEREEEKARQAAERFYIAEGMEAGEVVVRDAPSGAGKTLEVNALGKTLEMRITAARWAPRGLKRMISASSVTRTEWKGGQKNRSPPDTVSSGWSA